MKYILPIAVIALSISACTTDLVIPDLTPEFIQEDQGYISVTVTQVSTEVATGGCDPDGQYINAVEGAMIQLTYLEEEERPLPDGLDLHGYTDQTGRHLFDELPAGRYRLVINSRLGMQMHEADVSLGNVSRVRARF